MSLIITAFLVQAMPPPVPPPPPPGLRIDSSILLGIAVLYGIMVISRKHIRIQTKKKKKEMKYTISAGNSEQNKKPLSR